ncbi:hypothetical protein AB4Y90_16675, partial [Chryseobacterium sp. 2TAF14]|uniref:hypothetical protein n=1 Tax=Chryseobacterium sp. 2TAF14 TaxID=3233007 RepID=UPI003F8E4294
FLNSLIEVLNTRKTNCSDEELKDIKKHIFILENRIISEYDKINIDIEDNILDTEEISIETSEFVKKTLNLYKLIDGFFKTEDDLKSYKNNHNLNFNGFDEHNDVKEFYGAADYAEYLIDYEGEFASFKNIIGNGTSSDTYQYLKALDFFENKEVNADSIIEFSSKKIKARENS